VEACRLQELVLTALPGGPNSSLNVSPYAVGITLTIMLPRLGSNVLTSLGWKGHVAEGGTPWQGLLDWRPLQDY
jgi:hypothetical protein